MACAEILMATDAMAFFQQATKAMVDDQKASYRQLARDLGLGAPNAVQRICAGQRPLQREVWKKLIQILGADDLESEYSDLLWELFVAQTHTDKDKYWKALSEMRRQRQVVVLEDQQYAFFRHWYMPVVWELAVHPHCKGAEWIARQIRPRIDVRKVRTALETLEELGLLIRGTKAWKRENTAISTPPKVKATAVARYHADILQLAEMSMDQWGPDQRSLHTVMVGLSESRLRQLQSRLAQVWQEILGSVPEDEPVERVYQVSFQMFPLTPKLDSKNVD